MHYQQYRMIASARWLCIRAQHFVRSFKLRYRTQAWDRTRILSSPALVGALGILLLNDHVLKPALHNWVTGKLSDFAGVFLFPMFLTAVAPHRKPWIYLFTVMGFV